jgi:transcriptional regulator with XRE-family HTH domain
VDHNERVDRGDLADFLRRRRAELTPAAVGLPAGQRRRTAGLRREEVAQIVGMSVNYYTRLEQARGPQPSAAMLASIARGLRLSHDERDYLFRIAGHPAPERADGLTHVAPGMRRLLDHLEDTPAIIVSDIGETLVSNRLATLLLGDHTAYTGLARMEAYRWFTDPAARGIYPADDHAQHSRSLVAGLRRAVADQGARSRARDLIDALLAESSEFAQLWAQHEVGRCAQEHKTVIHPEVGPIEFDLQFLYTEDRGQTLRVLTAAPNSAAEQQLQLVAMLSASP